MDAYVEPHLTWRPLASEDFAEVELLREQLEALDPSVLSGMAAAIIEGDPHVVPELAIGGWDSYDSLCAYGVGYLDESATVARMYLMGGVHPARRHQWIGSRLLAWQVEAAEQWRRQQRPSSLLWLVCHAELGRPGLERTARRLGFSPERYNFDLQRSLSEPIPQLTAPGVHIVPFQLAHAEAARVLHNYCFQPLGAEPVSRRTWCARLDEAKLEWSRAAVNPEGELVGYAISSEDSNDSGEPLGWTERFGVHPQHRGRGVALALLAGCLNAMRESGCTDAGIGIDTDHGAGIDTLCAALGYTTRDAVALLSKALSP